LKSSIDGYLSIWWYFVINDALFAILALTPLNLLGQFGVLPWIVSPATTVELRGEFQSKRLVASENEASHPSIVSNKRYDRCGFVTARHERL
jgi:hypothetical protein